MPADEPQNARAHAQCSASGRETRRRGERKRGESLEKRRQKRRGKERTNRRAPANEKSRNGRNDSKCVRVKNKASISRAPSFCERAIKSILASVTRLGTLRFHRQAYVALEASEAALLLKLAVQGPFRLEIMLSLFQVFL